MPLLIDCLVTRYPTASRTTLKRMVEEGRVTVNGRRADKLKQPVADADVVAVDERPARREPERSSGPQLQIIFEDEDLLVVHKPPGLLTSTVAREKRPTLLAMVREHVKAKEPRARVGLIHRLDRDAEGLLVFSKNTEAYDSLKAQFFKHTVDRVYTAVVEGKPLHPEGRIHTRLAEWTDGTVKTTKSPDAGQDAITEFVVLRREGERALLRVTLHTGRKHQIRAHLSERGMPILGDPVYGPNARQNARSQTRLMLFATTLAFAHPRTGKRVSFELPLPDAMKRAIGGK